MAEVYGSRRRRPWGRRILITLIVLLIILGVILFVADRLGRNYAENMISDKVAQQVTEQKATSEKPDVTIEGFPFLTQVAAGKYHEIKIDLANFTGPANQDGSKKLSLPLLDIRANDVKAPISALRSGGSIVAGSVSGTGTIDYRQLASLINQPGLTLQDKDGKLAGSAQITALGRKFTVTGTASLTVSGDTVKVRFSNVDSPDLPDIPAVKVIVASYAQRLALDVQVPSLPLKLKVQKVQAQPNGLQFTAGASNVTLNSSGV